ncbi:hypothetical protein, partial [Sphingomonas sp.]|uniref:hypothetical protein n=1 Tax=Sphingomonas sp. TaxID=28214 RepID=UPI003B3B41EB
MTHAIDQDAAAIDALIGSFYAVFDNRGGRTIPVVTLREMFLAGAIITRASPTGIETMSVETFIAPRARILSDGTLADFHEWEVDSSTRVLRDIASRRSTYAKRGRSDGAPYAGGGATLIQRARAADGWRIAS